MSELGKLVAVRSLDEVVIKGWTFDFRPNRDFFHVEEEGAAAPVRVPIENLKAVFFIKTLGRDPSCVDRRSFEKRVGPEKKVWIEFVDGEKMAGWSSSFGSPRRGFFVFPADPDSNMEMAYVFRSAIARMEEGEAAERAAREFNACSDEPPSSDREPRFSTGQPPSLAREPRRSTGEPPSSAREPRFSTGEPPSSAWERKSEEDGAVGTYRMVRKKGKRGRRDTG